MRFEKYILTKPYNCSYGTLAEGTEFIFYNNMVYVNGTPIQEHFAGIFQALAHNPEYSTRLKVSDSANQF